MASPPVGGDTGPSGCAAFAAATAPSSRIGALPRVVCDLGAIVPPMVLTVAGSEILRRWERSRSLKSETPDSPRGVVFCGEDGRGVAGSSFAP